MSWTSVCKKWKIKNKRPSYLTVPRKMMSESPWAKSSVRPSRQQGGERAGGGSLQEGEGGDFLYKYNSAEGRRRSSLAAFHFLTAVTPPPTHVVICPCRSRNHPFRDGKGFLRDYNIRKSTFAGSTICWLDPSLANMIQCSYSNWSTLITVGLDESN